MFFMHLLFVTYALLYAPCAMRRALCPMRFALCAMLLVMGLWTGVVCADEIIAVEMEGSEAAVTFLQGHATVWEHNNKTSPSPLKLHATLRNGDKVATGQDTRVELTFADESLLRFDEETTFELITVNCSKETNQRDVNVKIVLGRTWANVSSIIGKDKGFNLHAKNAVAGVRGTIYRMNAEKDNSTVVKVYSGEVTVRKPVSVDRQPLSMVEPPHSVPGPQAVSGPREVSMEEWTYIVRAMQQIVIRPDGTAEEPVTFSAKADSNEWVRWNQQRDSKD